MTSRLAGKAEAAPRGRRPSARHRIEYALFRAASAVALRLPERVAEGGLAALARVAYRPMGIRREVVETQLRAAFPERGEPWVRRTARGSYEHLGRATLGFLRVGGLDPAALLGRTRIRPGAIEGLRAALARGRGLVIVTGHFGSWEVAGALLAANGLPVHAVVQRQSNPLFDEAVNALRDRAGIQVIDRRVAARRGLEILRGGGMVAFVADQDARSSGIFVPFMGRPASTHRGPALLALRSGAPLFLGWARRLGTGRYEADAREIETDRGGPVDAAVHRLTAAFTAALEAVVRESPEQYFWQHRRWKTAPPEEPTAG